MWELALLILCEAIGGAVLSLSLRLGSHSTAAETQAKCVTGWTVFIIICTLLGYGVMKASILSI